MLTEDIAKELMLDREHRLRAFNDFITNINSNDVFRKHVNIIEITDLEGGIIKKITFNRKVAERDKIIENIVSSNFKVLNMIVGKVNIYFNTGNEDIIEIVSNYTNQILSKNLEINLLKSHQKLVLNTLPKGMLILDKNGKLKFINDEGAKILCVDKKNSYGSHISELVNFTPVILDVFKNGKGYKNREIIVDSDDKQIHFLKSATPIKDIHGNVISVIDTFEKIKDVKRVVNNITGAYAKFEFEDIIGEDKNFKECLRLAQVASKSSSNVLIYGESGTGKELCAHAIHNESSRRKYPFISINCAAIPRDLLESELFGYDEGSFTGALKKGKVGKFELAQKGSVFLDEIGDMPLDMQAKLLRVIQDRKVNRIGSNHLVDVDVRIICATNKNLFKLSEEGKFRKDLYYRLNVLNIMLIPLRERISDMKRLSTFFLNKFNEKLEKNILGITDDVYKLFNEYSWPGNVRELENTIERAVNLCQSKYITTKHLDSVLFKKDIKPNTILYNSSKIESTKIEIKTLAEIEKNAIEEAINVSKGNISEAAKILGITRNTIYNKIKKYI